jgi:hypothetical protein
MCCELSRCLQSVSQQQHSPTLAVQKAQVINNQHMYVGAVNQCLQLQGC